MFDFSKNSNNLKWDPDKKRFNFRSKEEREEFAKSLKVVFKDPNTRIICDNSTFSAKDKASEKFLNTKFFDLMLKSLEMKDEREMLKHINTFKVMSINFDEYYHQRDMIEKININPGRFVNKDTPVCYIFNPQLSDMENEYKYQLYVKAKILINNDGHYDIHIMSCHWGERDDKEHPYEVWNKREKRKDNISIVMKYLRDTYEREEKTEER